MTSNRRAASSARSRKKYPERSRARNKVARAIKRGDLIRPDACGRCGKPCKPEASHDDYDRPLDVEWLCRLCHRAKDFPKSDSCFRGHLLSGDNLIIKVRDGKSSRCCRTCNRLRDASRRAKAKQRLTPDTPARTKPTTASLLADLAATREADQGAREKRALGGAS